MSERKYIERGVGGRNLEEGETIEGKLIDIQPGPQSDILVIELEDGGMERIWASFQLANNLSVEDLNKYVRIEFKGMATTKAGRPMRDFAIAVASE